MAQPAPSAHPARELILTAAERLFADCGYEATTIRDVAVAARVNSALLYYYFGDKERLYRAVLERVVRRTAHAAEQVRGSAAGLLRTLADVIAEGQRLAQFRCDIDPRFGAISTVSLVAQYFTARSVIGVFLGGSTAGPPPETTQAYARHAVSYALAALGAPPKPAPSTHRGSAAGA